MRCINPNCEENTLPIDAQYCGRCGHWQLGDDTIPGKGEARSRVLQVFTYLQAAHELRYPIQREINKYEPLIWLRKLPKHECIILGPMLVDDGDTVYDFGNTFEEGFILKVHRPSSEPPPEPPSRIRDWLEGDWRDPNRQVSIKTTLHTSRGIDEDFKDNPRRQQEFEKWKDKHDRWAERERLNLLVKALFKDLREVYLDAQREAEGVEIVLGNGLLTWCPREDYKIHHPLLLLRLQLQFDTTIHELTLVETKEPTDLYTALLQAIPADIGNYRQHRHWKYIHPLGREEATRFLEDLVEQLSSDIHIIEDANMTDQDNTINMAAPTVFVRRRTLGFSQTLRRIQEDLTRSKPLPPALLGIVGINTDEGPPPPSNVDILFSKPANADQVKIAQKLAKERTVVVQGPPGTGKTHTIGNLLGHLLAQGKSVLVTSHTAKALDKLLKDHVVMELQSLCVSILDNNLADTVNVILDRLGPDDAEKLERAKALEDEADAYKQQRQHLLEELRQTRERLRQARLQEYEPVELAGEKRSPSEVARILAAKKETDAWIPKPCELNLALSLDKPLPLSESELHELYDSNANRNDLEKLLLMPDPKELVAPDYLKGLIEERAYLEPENKGYLSRLWQNALEGQTAERLHNLKRDILSELRKLQLDKATRWQLLALEAGREGGASYMAWDTLIAEIEYLYRKGQDAYFSGVQYQPMAPQAWQLDQVQKVLGEIMASLRSHPRLYRIMRYVHLNWWVLIKHSRIGRQPPERLEDFEAIHNIVQWRLARENLIQRWKWQMEVLGAYDISALGPELEQFCLEEAQQLRLYVDWFSKSGAVLEQQLMQLGFSFGSFLTTIPRSRDSRGLLPRLHTALQRLPDVIEAEINSRAYRRNQDTLKHLSKQLKQVCSSAAHLEVVQRLLIAVDQLDISAYLEAYNEIGELFRSKEQLQRRRILLNKLNDVIPAWADAICKREGIHGQTQLPGNPEEAWRWRLCYDELERRALVSLDELQGKITDLGRKIERVTTILVEKQAWAARIRNTTPKQKRALREWSKLMSDSNGTGKRARRARAKASQKMPICQQAIPVWIMPLSHVVEIFDPRENHFDVVIIDEASQADLTSLAAIYMGDQVVIVGDKEQVSTEGKVGQADKEIEALIRTHLADIPEKEDFDGKTSLYERAETSFGAFCLKEHFRCVPSIIQFSNRLSYFGNIKPLRDDSRVKTRPFLVECYVEGAVGAKKRNEKEAIVVASLLVAATEQPEYQTKVKGKYISFGVISMPGPEQARDIQGLLLRHLGDKKFELHNILCGEPAQFQGDERDIVFISMVDAPKSGSGPLDRRTADSYAYRYKRQFNVAASRARDQMWVVDSLDPNDDLKKGDIRRELILFAKGTSVPGHWLDEQDHEAASMLEREVYSRLTDAGYHVKRQWAVGPYRIDMVVEGNGQRLAIECIGDLPFPPTEDTDRMETLDRLGWRFVYIRGIQYFLDSEKTMEVVFSHLHAFNILPGRPVKVESVPDNREADLKKRIINRAEELRRQWIEQDAYHNNEGVS